MPKNWRTFKKGDLLYTECGFPAFVYEGQTMKDIIQIYAFGFFDEHGSEWVEKARKTGDKKAWLASCLSNGYSKDYVRKTAKRFGVEI